MANAEETTSAWIASHTIAGAGEKTISFATSNKFVDKDIHLILTTPAAASPSLSLTDITTGLSMGEASGGKYSPSVSLNGNANVSTAGWIAAGNHTVADNNVLIGTVNQSTMANGNTAISSGDTITPSTSAQTITISEGYNAARTLIVGASDSAAPATITSGSATIDTLSYAYDSTNNVFNITGSADVSAPTVGTAGYISSSKGTRNANTNGAAVSTTVNKIAIQANLSGTGTKTPVIAKDGTETNISGAGTATTSKPSSGYYIAVASPANTGTVAATATVTSAGYGTTTSGQYSTTDSSSLTVGAAASATTYIPISAATFANSGTSGTTYTDYSSSAPALVSGDYLYINAGYVPDYKISLAKLVPDASAVSGLAAAHILSGHSAYDNDGALIVGTIQTYDGSYDIT